MEETLPQKLPVHLGIIMDGNGRWAKRVGCLVRWSCRGGGQFKKITLYCASIGIRYLTVYAFPQRIGRAPRRRFPR